MVSKYCLFVTLFVIASCTQKKEQAPATTTESAVVREGNVPPVATMDIKISFGKLDHGPVSQDQIEAALQLIESLVGKAPVNTADDLAIMELLSLYRQRVRTLRTVKYRTAPKGSAAANRMAYSCDFDAYAINPDLVSDTRLLASSLYHEMIHAVDCIREMIKRKITNHRKMRPYVLQYDACAEEPRGYGAQIRLLYAMYQKKILDSVTIDRGGGSSDVWVLQRTPEVWRALDTGTFCKWFTRRVGKRRLQ